MTRGGTNPRILPVWSGKRPRLKYLKSSGLSTIGHDRSKVGPRPTHRAVLKSLSKNKTFQKTYFSGMGSINCIGRTVSQTFLTYWRHLMGFNA